VAAPVATPPVILPTTLRRSTCRFAYDVHLSAEVDVLASLVPVLVAWAGAVVMFTG